MTFNCLFQHQIRREGSVSKWYKHLSHRIVTPPSGLSTRASFKQHLMITERVFSPRNLQSLDATFRDTLKLSFGQTGRHCHFESCLGKQEKSQSQVVIGHILRGCLSIPACLAHVRALVGKKEVCRDPGSVLIETFRALLIVGDTALQLSQFILGAPRFKQRGGHNTRDAALVSSGSSRKPVLLSTQ